MKASKFSDAQKAFILKQGADGSTWLVLAIAGVASMTAATNAADRSLDLVIFSIW